MSGPADGRDPEGGGPEGRGPDGGGPGGAGHGEGGREDAFVAFLREAASGYHRPPPTPRDAMWEGVRAGLAGRGSRLFERAEGPAGRVTGIPDREATPAPADDGAMTEALEEARSTYHRPPETPADEMWPAVAAAWRRRGVTPLRPAGDGGDGRSDDAGSAGASVMPAWVRIAGVAAVLAVGVLVGRATIDDAVPPPASVATDDRGAPGDGEGPGPADAGGGERIAGASAAGEDGAAPDADRGDPDAGDPPSPGAAPAERVDNGTDRADAGRLAAAGEGAAGRAEARRRGATFRAAAYAHLGRSELFLAGFRMDSLAAEPTARRARDLLSETRLYLDWARDDSPHLTALLEDLELVLAQIARLDESTWARERAVVLDGMERRDVLSLLRSTVPATPGPWNPARPSGT